MQTHEWEALLDGTTPGPWREDSDDGILGRRKGEVENWELDPVVGHMNRDSDNTLASVAPEAVAEVVRLRRALEDAIRSLRAPLCSHMPEGDELDEYLKEWEMQGYAAHILTRILEGDTDE